MRPLRTPERPSITHRKACRAAGSALGKTFARRRSGRPATKLATGEAHSRPAERLAGNSTRDHAARTWNSGHLNCSTRGTGTLSIERYGETRQYTTIKVQGYCHRGRRIQGTQDAANSGGDGEANRITKHRQFNAGVVEHTSSTNCSTNTRYSSGSDIQILQHKVFPSQAAVGNLPGIDSSLWRESYESSSLFLVCIRKTWRSIW